MPSNAIWFGRLLVLIGVIGYGYGLYGGNQSLTALIPAAFGLALMVLGHIAQGKDSLRMHLMHAAAVIGLLGFLLPAGRILSKINDITISAAFISQVAMSLVCLVFVIFCVRSFIAARRDRVGS